MKFNRKCVKNMCVVFLIGMLGVVVSCDRQTAYSKLLTEEYPDLYSYVFERNADSLLTYTDHPDSYIRDQAWRALISTPVEAEKMDDFITKVQYSKTEMAWTALSTKSLSSDQVSRLQNLWETRESMRSGISLVLGLQGNENSLNYLVGNFENFIDTEFEYETALAISRLMMRHDLLESTKKILLKYAAVIDDPDLFRAYFYGFYRMNEGFEDEEMRDIMLDTYELASSAEIKQYAARILFNTDAEWFFSELILDGISGMNVQLAVELAQHSSQLSWSEKLADFYSHLLEHGNPVVNEVALTQLANRTDKPVSFDEMIASTVVNNNEKEASVRLSGIQAISDPATYLSLVDELAETNEYLLTKKLQVNSEVLTRSEYLELLEDHFNSESLIEISLATQGLSGWWQGLSDSEKDASTRAAVKELVINLLEKENRTITFNILNFMNNSGLVEEGDFELMTEIAENYSLPRDIEVFQALGSLLNEHFEEEGRSLITELAREGNTALNNSFQQQGWDLPDVEPQEKTFRQPNWSELAALNFEPTWVLETEKGDIKIVIDVLAAPATISGIDSLTRAGAYDKVAIHRVVPNFVIQGGDVETGLGLGGPDYVVPTEASEKKYKRGTVGIASAGTDTEGSQYFVMHQWKPHLNAGYTVIGEVIEGMDVVDRIVVGDKVTKAYWNINEE
ncbi:peptidylprolyl isomerase [Gracilimonas sp.]|uniref:peptidylprolyl isomerase n=1 Tax=Gracilimonas sp. TaxID=1974203 RepID=UPI002870EA3F|nr:peptidylprolyl isomerase [Gracilimonas sp.]